MKTIKLKQINESTWHYIENDGIHEIIRIEYVCDSKNFYNAKILQAKNLDLFVSYKIEMAKSIILREMELQDKSKEKI